MKIIYTKHINMNLFFVILIEEKEKDNPVFLNHEKIHSKHWLEFGIVFFPIFYFLGRVWADIFLGDLNESCMEQEAYINENDLLYLENRKPYAWFKYSLLYRLINES